MKNKKFLEIFGEENPSARKFRDWVLENNPLTFQPWNPPLNDNEKSLLNDHELSKDCPWGYRYGNVERIAVAISNIREAESSDISNEQLFFLLRKFKEEWRKSQTPKKKTTIVLFDLISLLKKYGIFIDKIINNLEKRFQERKKEIFKDLSQWTIEYHAGSKETKIIHKLNSEMSVDACDLPENDYNSLRKSIIQIKIKDIENNPQNWEIIREKSIYGEISVEVVKKDGGEKLRKEFFSGGEFTQIEWKLEGFKNVKFWFPPVLVLTIILLLIFLWWYKRKV